MDKLKKEDFDRLREAMSRFREMAEEDQEIEKAKRLAGPVARPADLLVRDPVTQERRAFYAITPTQNLKIRFRLMSRGDLKYVPEEDREKAVIDWPDYAKAQIIRSCLVEPEIEWPDTDDPGELAQWVDESFNWAALDDVLFCIYNESQPKMRVPDLRSEEVEKGGPPYQPPPPTE